MHTNPIVRFVIFTRVMSPVGGVLRISPLVNEINNYWAKINTLLLSRRWYLSVNRHLKETLLDRNVPRVNM